MTGEASADEHALAEMSDAWLLGRATELIAVIQASSPERQPSFVARFDELLTEARRRGEPRVLCALLRASAVARIVTPSMVGVADPLLDELLAHTRRHGLLVLEADAHALRGMRALLADAEDTALTEVAQALAMLDEEPEPDVLFEARDWYRALSNALVDVALVLTHLGMYEDADPVLARAHRAIRDAGGPHEIVVQLINRVKLLVSWGLRLERVGERERAAERFATAAAISNAAAAPYAESLFPHDSERSVTEQVPELAAAISLHEPSPEHIPRLRGLLQGTVQPRYLIVMAIALGRCLEEAGQAAAALTVLIDTRDRLVSDNTEQTLRLSLLREYARLCGQESDERTAHALQMYCSELEYELWARRSSQISALSARREHERLSREHGAITRQAMQDPLTGLPNRRALDERLAALAASTSSQPLSIALIDLDGFKGVNDRSSHADGDDVLRIVASTLRDALRGDDLVTRYGGDEFVALLPGASLDPATAALGRAVDTVADLPDGLSKGVTLSVGVVTMLAHETTSAALARADAAMYVAKHQGGNRVAAAPQAQDGAAAGEEVPDYFDRAEDLTELASVRAAAESGEDAGPETDSLPPAPVGATAITDSNGIDLGTAPFERPEPWGPPDQP